MNKMPPQSIFQPEWRAKTKPIVTSSVSFFGAWLRRATHTHALPTVPRVKCEGRVTVTTPRDSKASSYNKTCHLTRTFDNASTSSHWSSTLRCLYRRKNRWTVIYSVLKYYYSFLYGLHWKISLWHFFRRVPGCVFFIWHWRWWQDRLQADLVGACFAP